MPHNVSINQMYAPELVRKAWANYLGIPYTKEQKEKAGKELEIKIVKEIVKANFDNAINQLEV